MSARTDRFCIQSRWSRLNRGKPNLSHDVLALIVVGEDYICDQRIITITDGRIKKQRHHYLRHSMRRDGVSGAECVMSKAVTYGILRGNESRLRRMICQPRSQNHNVSIRDVCHVPVSSHLGSRLTTIARWSPERSSLIKHKAQRVFVHRRRLAWGSEFSRQPSNRRQPPSHHGPERTNDGHDSQRDLLPVLSQRGGQLPSFRVKPIHCFPERTECKSRNATVTKVGTLTVTRTKSLKTGGSDGARTRDLRRDRPTL
jgi:hypothetical protein